MAPLRRYLRITKHSVLEVRIYLDRPSDAEAWLLRRENPALPRVIQAVRPLVLPKLREENERAKGRGGSKNRKKGVKDVVVEVLTKQKLFKHKARIQSNSGKLTGWLTTGTKEKPILLGADRTESIVIREEEDHDSLINLDDVPEAGGDVDVLDSGSNDDVPLRYNSSLRQNKRKKGGEDDGVAETYEDKQDDKKKLGLSTSYEGFSIYGRILCLVVKRKGPRTAIGGSVSSQQMMEHWVSTQAAAEHIDDDEDN